LTQKDAYQSRGEGLLAALGALPALTVVIGLSGRLGSVRGGRIPQTNETNYEAGGDEIVANSGAGRYSRAVHWFRYLGDVVAAYLLGSIPTGYLVARAKGIDIRAVGSGNIGATNVFRILGKTAGVLVLLADALKGFLACRLIAALAGMAPAGVGADGRPTQEHLALVAGVAAILGHNYPVWLKFKGGKGVATTAGVFVGLAPWALLVALGAWCLTLAVSRYVSLASIAAAIALPVAVWACGGSQLMNAISVILGALAIYKHKANIQRLLNGTEHRFGSAKRAANPPP